MTAGETDTGADTSGATGGGDPFFCGDDPPKGFMGDANPECENKPAVGMFEPVVEWQKTSWTAAPTYNQMMMAPIVAKVDGDDIPDILYVTYSSDVGYTSVGVIRAISGDGQTEVLSIADGTTFGCSGLAAGDIDGDGLIEIVAVSTATEVKVYENDGTLKWTSSPVMSPTR